MNFNDFSAQDGSENDPKLAQNHSKTVPKAIIFHVEFLLQFWSVLGSVLAPFWDPRSIQNRTKNRSKIKLQRHASTGPPREAVRPPQELPRPPQDRPKSSQDPGEPKTLLKGFKIAPRSSQDHPRVIDSELYSIN